MNAGQTATFSVLATGVLFGKTPLAPKISPKKTWEGFAGSALFGSVAGYFIATYMLHIDWWWGIIIAAVLTLSAVFGDLAESLIKRDLGVKDMSSLLPGHGGVMDRLDSILPAALIAYLFASIFFPIAQ